MGKDKEIDWTDPDSVAAELGIGVDEDETPEGGEEAQPTADPSPEAAEEGKDSESVETSDGKPSQDGAQASADADNADDGTDSEPDGVQTRDGKHTLPYSVLKSAREGKAAAEARAAEAEAKLADYEKRKAAIEQSTANADVSQEEFERLEDDYPPEMLKYIRSAKAQADAAIAKANAATQKLEALEAEKQSQITQDENDRIAAEHHTAIEQAPLLKRLQDTGGPMWEQAKAIDQRLLREQEEQGKRPASRAEHYKAVEAEMRSLMGIPAADNEQTQEKPKKPLPAADSGVPSSLSTIPGGTPPASTESESFLEMNDMRAVAKLTSMTPKQQDEFLARNFG